MSGESKRRTAARFRQQANMYNIGAQQQKMLEP